MNSRSRNNSFSTSSNTKSIPCRHFLYTIWTKNECYYRYGFFLLITRELFNECKNVFVYFNVKNINTFEIYPQLYFEHHNINIIIVRAFVKINGKKYRFWVTKYEKHIMFGIHVRRYLYRLRIIEYNTDTEYNIEYLLSYLCFWVSTLFRSNSLINDSMYGYKGSDWLRSLCNIVVVYNHGLVQCASCSHSLTDTDFVSRMKMKYFFGCFYFYFNDIFSK